MNGFTSRMLKAALLDASVYEEVESDRKATGQAVAVVLLASAAAALGAGTTDMREIIGVLVAAILSWIVWVLLTLFIGTQLLPGRETHADFGQVLRTTGFSASPGILRLFAAIPGTGSVVFAITTVWMLVAFVIAIRQSLDYTSTGRAFAVCVLGWLVHAILFFGFVLVAM